MSIKCKKRKAHKAPALLIVTMMSIHHVYALPDDYSGDHISGIEDIVHDAVARKGWRRDAYQRIDQYRKADLNITVEDASGRMLPNTEITIEQAGHEFPFGMGAPRNGPMNDKNTHSGLC